MGFEIVTEPWNLACHQKEGTADHIVQYAGVQAAFFFHLFNTFTRTDQLNQQLHDNISQHDGFALQHSAIGIYELHYNILQHITTYYNTLQHITILQHIYIYISTYHDLLQGYSVHIPVSCSNRSHRLFRWISGPAVLSVINFVLRRSPWVDKHQAGPWLKRKGRRMKKEYWYCFNMFQSDSIHRCWRYVSRCFNPIQSTSFNNFQSVCQMQMLDSAYGAMLCIWTTVFLVPWTYRPDVSTCRSDKAPVPPWNSIETTGTVNHGMANHVLMHCLYIYIHTCVYL